MPQTVQIETQAEQQGLARLHGQAAAWSSREQLAFDRGEHTLDQGSVSVQPLRKSPPHLGAHAVNAPVFPSALGGDHAVRRHSVVKSGTLATRAPDAIRDVRPATFRLREKSSPRSALGRGSPATVAG